MTFMMCLFLFGLVMGTTAVGSSPSPYYGGLGLVVAAGMGCGILVCCGGSFLSLVLFLIYLGGMLVVMAYSSFLAAERFPYSWERKEVSMYMALFAAVNSQVFLLWPVDWYQTSWAPMDDMEEFIVYRSDMEGVAMMYSSGGGMLVITVWALLLTLLVVLEVARIGDRGAIKAV
uniref:NADH-ubiquinone oxidoreductase chain 6 n=1 Tax=Psenopsis anomala TaxID=163124 RepID=R9RHV5_PSEAK|nr:NADH dehydrogenase subunit 6 [Psenopsis anomala]AGM48307.1 NADH dehydrogenase subunit 6 [Psenopsis anomala]BAX03875.1 NADH dehydrogenase subunit 6 [Psenopsis anomala]BBU26200.1 NADH dehydrogenase subunit 6 [Psenopsis anomala]